MTEYAWSELRDRAITLYVDTPSASIEQRILDVFTEKPQLVAQAIDHVHVRFQRGQVRSPWAVLAHHVEEAAATSSRASAATATDTTDRDLAVSRAEAWVRSAGLHFDRPEEIVDELFGDRGRLKAWAGDRDLVRRMVDLWLEQRPRGLQVEQEAEERARQQLEARARIAEAERRRRELAEVPPEVVEALGL